jgi:LmbE family N-acetylglucosaminyl deacetylase
MDTILERRLTRRDAKRKLANARLQYDTASHKRAARRMNKDENRARARRPSIMRVIGASLVALLIAGLAIHNDGVSASVVPRTPLQQRNRAVVHLAKLHDADSLVGPTWRLISLQNQPQSRLISFDDTCSNLRQLRLESSLRGSFAYVFNQESGDPTSSNCPYNQVVGILGQPSSRAIISGSLERPEEQLLFYDHGAKNPTDPQVGPAQSAQLTPLAKLPFTDCPGHRTILQIAAHEDDDLLFMNPDLQHSIQNGDCVRTVYLTAGDAGSSKFYWLNRERGSQAAYSVLTGLADSWTDTGVKIGDHRFANTATIENDSRFTLLFLHLPDGQPDGQGFPSSQFESLAKLVSGEQTVIHSVDDQSTFSKTELLQALQQIMAVYKPDEVRTLLPYNHSMAFSDHSDHMTTGALATQAFEKYQRANSAAKLVYYTGYPIQEQPANVEGDDLALKEQAFFMYAQFDNAVCGSMDVCVSRDYGEYLQRQYGTNL